MSLPRYSEYKDSGVDWLGQLPSHWTVCKYKQVFAERDERSSDGSEQLLSVSAYTGVTPRAEGLAEGDFLSRAESLEGYRICHPNDLVMNIMLAWNRGLGLSRHHGIVSPAYSVFRVIGAHDPRFLDYMVRSDRVILYYKAFSAGVIDSRLRLYPDIFSSLNCALPPPNEQRIIADFLDRETAKIDALIAEQEKLLALLAEKRQATISHAVTRGLNPNAPMRDSGIPWLGEVPAHWGVHSFRRELSSSISNGIFKKKDEFGSGALLVNVFDIYRPDFQVEYGGLDRVMCSDAEIDSYRVHAGDLFFVRSSLKVEGIAVAAVAPFCDEPAVYECHLIRARPRENSFNARFASYLFNSDLWRQHFIRAAKITTMTTIDQEAILSTPVLLPPYEEQMEISEFVHSELQRLDATRHSVDGAIVLLRERRSALIAAAVTGQIDVRVAEEARVA